TLVTILYSFSLCILLETHMYAWQVCHCTVIDILHLEELDLLSYTHNFLNLIGSDIGVIRTNSVHEVLAFIKCATTFIHLEIENRAGAKTRCSAIFNYDGFFLRCCRGNRRYWHISYCGWSWWSRWNRFR